MMWQQPDGIRGIRNKKPSCR